MDPIVIPAMIIGSAMSFGLSGHIPPQNYYAAAPKVERLYKENGRIVSLPTMDAAAAASACPNGSQVARQTTRVDGNREYLVWDLRCR
jgi:hypothetical protein